VRALRVLDTVPHFLVSRRTAPANNAQRARVPRALANATRWRCAIPLHHSTFAAGGKTVAAKAVCGAQVYLYRNHHTQTFSSTPVA